MTYLIILLNAFITGFGWGLGFFLALRLIGSHFSVGL